MKGLKGSGLPMGSYFQPVPVVMGNVEPVVVVEPDDEVAPVGWVLEGDYLAATLTGALPFNVRSR